MRINSTNVSSNKPTRSVSSDLVSRGKTSFSPRNEVLPGAKKTLSKTSPINHEELLALASDFKNGVIDKEQANARFVSVVVDGSVGKLNEKDREAMSKDIADFFSDDPDFMNKLQKNLRDLA